MFVEANSKCKTHSAEYKLLVLENKNGNEIKLQEIFCYV